MVEESPKGIDSHTNLEGGVDNGRQGGIDSHTDRAAARAYEGCLRGAKGSSIKTWAIPRRVKVLDPHFPHRPKLIVADRVVVAGEPGNHPRHLPNPGQ